MSSYTAKINRLKLNVVKDHPKKISGGGGSCIVLSRKVAENSGNDNDSAVGSRVLNNFSMIKRRTACCNEVIKETVSQDSSVKTMLKGDKLFDWCGAGTMCDAGPQYTGKTYGLCDKNKCGTVKDVAVARDYSEKLRRLKAGQL